MLSNQGFEYGVYPQINGAFAMGDASVMDLGIYPVLLGRGNLAPPAPSVMLPQAGKRYPVRPEFVFTVAPDNERDPMHFVLEIATSAAFTTILKTYDTRDDWWNWQYQVSTDGGATFSTWYSFPPTGMGQLPGQNLFKLKLTPDEDLALNNMFYWRVRAFDGQDYSATYSTNTVKIGDKIVATFNLPEDTGTVNARAIIAVVLAEVPTDGTIPATFKVEATNCGFDAAPKWEDITNAVLKRTSHAFANTTKTAAKFGVNIRITIEAKDSTGPMSLNGFSFNYA